MEPFRIALTVAACAALAAASATPTPTSLGQEKAVAETEATPATRRGRQLLKQWIPPPLWQLVERYEADWNGQVDDDYYDSIDHCHQRVSGLTGDGDAGRPATPAAVGARAVVSSLLTMFCVYSTNQVYVPYNTYQDAKETLNEVRKSSSWTRILERVLRLPFVVLRSLARQPLRTARQLGAIALGTFSFLIFH